MYFDTFYDITQKVAWVAMLFKIYLFLYTIRINHRELCKMA